MAGRLLLGLIALAVTSALPGCSSETATEATASAATPARASDCVPADEKVRVAIQFEPSPCVAWVDNSRIEKAFRVVVVRGGMTLVDALTPADATELVVPGLSPCPEGTLEVEVRAVTPSGEVSIGRTALQTHCP
ncbi:MAG: hypothetical protein ACKVVT_16900 [Dehalococcoidia bacterium]